MADQNTNRPLASAGRRRPRSRTAAAPAPQSLGAAIEQQHQRVIQIRALVDSQGKILHESYEFDPQEADLGFCCEGVSILLRGVIASLKKLAVPGRESTDLLALARAINTPRMELFAAQASAQAIENLMRDYEFGDEADLHVVMGSIADALGEVTQAIEPEKLGLPNPTS